MLPDNGSTKEVKCEDLEKVVVNDGPEKFFQVDSQLPLQEREELIEFLKKNVNVFAWSAYEALGVDPNFFCHHLNVNPSVTPKKQHHRCSSRDHSDVVKDEVTKLKQARAIKEVFYPEWLANTVVVKKKNGKWRVCVDFTDLNKACPKNHFSPPASDRPIGRCNSRPSSDELPRCLLGIPPDTTRPGRLGKDSFYHSHWKLPLQSDALWIEKRRIYLSKDDDENTTVRQEH